jgi:hypothetical protein
MAFLSKATRTIKQRDVGKVCTTPVAKGDLDGSFRYAWYLNLRGQGEFE